MRRGSGSTNVLEMDLNFYTDRPVEVKLSPFLVENIITYRVTKVERSKTGFRTSTQTLRSCAFCRSEDYHRSGLEPFTMATWLLTGESDSWYPVATLAVCGDHFKEMRENQRALSRGSQTRPFSMERLREINQADAGDHPLDARANPRSSALPSHSRA